MENKALNIRSENYPIINDVAELAEKEKRSISNMGSILLEEAIAARKLSTDGVPATDGL